VRRHRLRPLLALAPLLAAAGLPQLASASTTQQPIIQDDAQLQANPVGTLSTFRQLGVDLVRVSVNWRDIAPSPRSATMPARFHAADPAAYPAANWAPYDTIVRYAAADQIGVYFVLTGPAPQWAESSGEPAGGLFGVWSPSPAAFGAFAHAVGERYDGSYRPSRGGAPLPRVTVWSVWNEANYGYDLAPQANGAGTVSLAAANYRGLLAAAWNGLGAAGHTTRRDTILIGETAPRGSVGAPGNFGGTKPLIFLRALYCVDSGYRPLRGSAASAVGCPATAAGSGRFRVRNPALFQASGFADHPYTFQGHPVAPNVTTNSSGPGPSDPNYADLPVVPRLERVLDRLNAVYGSRTHYAIWNTEYGYRTRPPDPHAGVSQATAAYWLNWAEYLSWRQRRLGSYMQYLLVDPPSRVFASGLELFGGAHKASFAAFRMPLYLPLTATRRGARLEVWGGVRPSHFAFLDTGVKQRVAIQFRRGSRGAFRTLERVPIANPRGYFDVGVAFPSSGAVRLAWAYPDGQTILSRSVSITVR
jgi:hypothetical protein